MFKLFAHLFKLFVRLFAHLTDSNEREIKRLHSVVDRVNELEPDLEKLGDVELRAKTDEFKSRLAGRESLDDLLPEVFAAVREASKRALRQRHFDVQLMGGVVLHQGKIAEMKTGEGKTLVATLPLYLNSLTGKGCHLVTVNDYLAKRDCQWMGPVFHALGVSVASIQHDVAYLYNPDYDSGDEKWRFLQPIDRREAYQADVTYGTNNEFGFDYLRDNMVLDLSKCVQRSFSYAIVDEVDNILIDEARTPLIISGAAEDAASLYMKVAGVVRRLPGALNERDYVDMTAGRGKDEAERILNKKYDYRFDEKARTATLTERGESTVADAFGIPDLYGERGAKEGKEYSFEEQRSEIQLRPV